MMSPSSKLFDVSIGTAVISCTTPAERVYLLEFNSPPDNRLNSSFCQALLTALDILEARHPHGVVITTSKIAKFYSNGLDLEHANSTPNFFEDSLYAVWRRLLTYPMPTIALLNGHAFAGALMTAMYHADTRPDYRIMNPHRGYLCLNELELGVPLKPAMSSIFRQKVSPHTYRTLVLEAKRYKALDALKDGIIDGVGNLEETLTLISEISLVKKAEKGVYGALKREMWRESLALLEQGDDGQGLKKAPPIKKDVQDQERRIKDWEKATKAKL